MLRPFARPVACCCNRLLTTATETQQQETLLAQQCGLSYVQMNATTPNFFSPTMLGVVASVCTWITFDRFQTLRINY